VNAPFLTATFSGPLTPSSVTDASVTLRGLDAGLEPGVVELFGTNTVRFRPARPLVSGWPYTWRFEGSISSSGLPFSGASIDFSTRPPAAVPVGLSDAGVVAPLLGMDPAGNVVLVHGTLDVWSRTYDVGTQTWSAPQRLDTGTAASTPTFAIDGLGNGLASWSESSAVDYAVVSRRYDPLSRMWGTPVRHAVSDGGLLFAEATALNPQGGNAVVAWRQFDGQRYDLVAKRGTLLSSSTLWGSALPVETSLADVATRVRAQLDDQGNAVLLFRSGAPASLWAASFTVGATAWTTEQLTATANEAFDLATDGTSFWALYEVPQAPNRVDVVVRRRSAGAWQAPLTLSANADTSSSSTFPRVAGVSASRRSAVLAGWTERLPPPFDASVVRVRFFNGVAWSAPQSFGNGATHVWLAMGPLGHGAAVWLQVQPTSAGFGAAIFDPLTQVGTPSAPFGPVTFLGTVPPPLPWMAVTLGWRGNGLAAAASLPFDAVELR
jgi:hypothetical protein